MQILKGYMSVAVAALVMTGGSVWPVCSKPVHAATSLDYASHPAREAIIFALQKGYMWKHSDGRFYPEKQITQGQFVSSLVAIRGVKETTPVTQLPDGHWAKTTYERAAKAGILVDVTVDPNRPLTKEETAQLVFNAWKPYRGEKKNGFTNTGALVTWGWMKPAPKGQPQFREDLPVTRGEAAEILRYLWNDKYQLELGEKYAFEFHKSLKVENGYFIGKVPQGDKLLYLNAQIFTKNNSVLGFENGQSFKVPISLIKSASFTATNRLDSSNAAVYFYTKIPNLNREKNTKQFSR